MASLGGPGSATGWPPSTAAPPSSSATSRPLGSRNPFRDDAAAAAHDNEDGNGTVIAQQTAQPSLFGEDTCAQTTASSSTVPALAQEQKGGGGSSKNEAPLDDLVGAMAETSLDGGAAASPSMSQPTTTASTSSQPQVQSRAPALPSFEPTTTPIPGRPLLRNGQILVMPPTWDGCDACQGTGYICGDPSEPHDPCWEAYGRTWREGIEYSDEVVEGAMILQQGLPEQPLIASSSGSAGAGGSGSAYRPPAGPPPPDPSPAPQPSFSAPSHPPPPRHPSITASHRPRPRSPPRVNRAQDAGEAGDDALGEAPPAYEDVLRAPVGMALPPQTRVEAEQRHEQQQQQSASSAVHSPPPHAPPPLRPPIAGPGSVPGAYVGGGGYGAGPSHWRPPPLSPQQHQQGWSGYPGSPHHSGGGPSSPYHQPYPPHHQPPWGAHPHQYPHPHAHAHQPVRPLYVQPGDARIGGMLCWKCEGTGTKTSWFWGDEGNCSACGGLGRIR